MEAVILLVFLAPETNDAAMRKEFGQLEGTWKVTAAEHKGKKLDPLPFERVIFAAGKARDEAAKKKGAGVFKYRLDLEKAPKVIEGTSVDDGKKPQQIIGIYEVTNDVLKLCLIPKGKQSSARFETKPDDEAILLELRREKK